MKRITLKDIAGCCGVTPTLVSAVLNRHLGKISCSAEKKRLIEKTALRLGYRPNLIARSMVSRNVPVVALMLHLDRTSFRCGNNYFAETASQLTFPLQEKGLEVLLVFYREEKEQIERFHSLLGNGLIGGVVSNLIPREHSEFVTEIKKAEIPYALLGHSDLPAFCVRGNTQLSVFKEIRKRFDFKQCYLLQHEFGKEVLFPFYDAPDYDRFREVPIEATQELVGDPDNLIVSLGAEYILQSSLHIARPFIQERKVWSYRIPPGIPHALFGDGSITEVGVAAKMISEWMICGKHPEERELVIPFDGTVELYWE